MPISGACLSVNDDVQLSGQPSRVLWLAEQAEHSQGWLDVALKERRMNVKLAVLEREREKSLTTLWLKGIFLLLTTSNDEKCKSSQCAVLIESAEEAKETLFQVEPCPFLNISCPQQEFCGSEICLRIAHGKIWPAHLAFHADNLC